MDDLIGSYIQSSKWSDRNSSSRVLRNGSGISMTDGLLANSVEAYKEVNYPSIGMTSSSHIIKNMANEDLSVQGHDGTPNIFADGNMKYEILEDLYPSERLPNQNLGHQFANSVSVNNGTQVRSLSQQKFAADTAATAAFQSTLPHSALAISSSIESNSSELSLFPDTLGDAHSITSVPTIWPSMYSSVSAFMEQENLPFSYQGNENDDEMFRKMSFDNGSFLLGRLSDASLPIKVCSHFPILFFYVELALRN